MIVAVSPDREYDLVDVTLYGVCWRLYLFLSPGPGLNEIRYEHNQENEIKQFTIHTAASQPFAG